MFITLIVNTIIYSVPYIAASLGETISQRAGIYNVGLEGYMLVGALGGYYGALLTDNVLIGLLFGIILGMVLSAVHAILTITFKADQIISGISIWLIGLGLTSYFYQMSSLRGNIEV